MALEQGQELGKFLYKLFEASSVKPLKENKIALFAKRIGVTKKEATSRGVLRIANPETRKRFKDSSRDWVKNAGSKSRTEQQQAVRQLTTPEAQLSATDSAVASELLVKAAAQSPDTPTWVQGFAMSGKEFQDPKAAEFLTRITLMPKDLREDPYVLQRELMRFSSSVDWRALSPEAQAENGMVFAMARRHIHELLSASRLSDAEKIEFSQSTMTVLGGEDVSKFKDLAVARQREEAKIAETIGVAGHDRMDESDLSQRFKKIKPVELPPDDQVQGNVKKAMDEIRQLLGPEPLQGGHNVRMAENVINKYLTKRDTKTRQLIVTPAEAAELRGFRARLEGYQEAMQIALNEARRVHSSIYLDPSEIEALVKNPILFFEVYSRSIELMIFENGYESDVLQDKLQRFKLLVDWYTSDSYDKRVGGEALDIEVMFDPRVSKGRFDEVAAARQRFTLKKAETLNTYHVRARTHDLLYSLQHMDQLPKDGQQTVLRLAQSLGDRGIYGGGAHYGELADIALQKISAIHKEYMNRPSVGIEQRSDGEMFQNVLRDVRDELRQERWLHEETYALHIRKQIEEMAEITGGNAESMLRDLNKISSLDSEDTCDAITAYAAALYTLRFEKSQNIMTVGATPEFGGLIEGITPFGGASWEDRLAFIENPRDWFLRKWKNWTDHARTIWHGRALVYIEKDPRLMDWAVEKTDLFWKKIQKYKDSWADLDAHHFDAAREQLLLHPDNPFAGASNEMKDQLEEYRTFIKLRAMFADHHYKERIETDHAFAHYLTTISEFNPRRGDPRDSLMYYVMVDLGGDFAQRDAIKWYGFWQSGVRRGAVMRAIRRHSVFRKTFEPGYDSKLGVGKNGIMVGADILDKADPVFNPKKHMRTHDTEKNFLGSLADGALTHPHMLFRAQLAVESEYNPLLRLDPDAERQLHSASRLFQIIQHRLQMSGETPINYALDVGEWRPEQQRIFSLVFDRLQDGAPMKPEEYVRLMKGYYHRVADTYQNGTFHWKGLESFLHMKYAKRFSSILWTDDIPLTQIEATGMMDVFAEEFQAEQRMLLEQAKDNVPLSRQVSERGRGRTALYVAGLYDMQVCVDQQMMNLLGTMDADPENAMKAMIAMDSTFFGYNSEADAAVSTLGAIAGFLESAKTRTSRWFKWLRGSSWLRQATGTASSPSWTVDQSHTFTEQLQSKRGSFTHRAPLMAEAVEAQTGLTKWANILTFKRRLYQPGVVNKALQGLNRVLNGHEAYKYTFRWEGIEKFINGRIGGLFAPHIAPEDRFERLVEWLNLNVPSGVFSFKGSNMVVYGALALLVVGGGAALEKQPEKEHHG